MDYLNADIQAALLQEITRYPFETPKVTVFGKTFAIPRSQVWFAMPDCDYRYSGLLIKAKPIPPLLTNLMLQLNSEFNQAFNGVLVNQYQDGKQSMGWHSDNEPEIVDGSDIFSISLGAARDFCFRHKTSKQNCTLLLASGDLLIMHYPTQKYWQHSLPKRLKISEPRWNFTFRQIQSNFHQQG